MISYEEYIVIHTLKKRGHSNRMIAKELGIDRRTVAKRLKEDNLKGYKQRVFKSKLDPYKTYIDNRLKQALPDRIPSTVILYEITNKGYGGSLRILQRYMQLFYRKTQPKKVKEDIIRFETKPGFQAQVDWTTIRSGKNPIYAFVMILSYSRAPFIYFTDSMKQEIWQECHEKAFVYFGGVPQTILYDNLKSAIIQRDKYGKNKHGFNNAFLDFSKGYFIPKFCKPYRAQTKGKVERINGYIKGNFYRPLRASLKGSAITITPKLLNTYISSWCERTNKRVHSTTKEPIDIRFEREKPYLKPYIPKTAKVSINNKHTTAISIPKIDISYYTTISDYEQILLQGARYAS